MPARIGSGWVFAVSILCLAAAVFSLLEAMGQSSARAAAFFASAVVPLLAVGVLGVVVGLALRNLEKKASPRENPTREVL